MNQTFSPVRRFKRNISGRDFVVGDLHGCFTRLQQELELRQYDPSRDRIFAVGDLVDRGLESPSVLDVVRRYDIQSVRGNHEDIIVRWHLHGVSDAFIRSNGGDWLLDLAGDEKSVTNIVAYMAALPYAIEIETDFGLVGIVHANIPLQSWDRVVQALEREEPNERLRRKLIWDRSRWEPGKASGLASLRRVAARLFGGAAREAGARIEGVAAVIVGHTPSREPMVSANVINVDTGLVYGGNLTLLRLDEVPMLLKGAARDARPFTRLRRYPVRSGI